MSDDDHARYRGRSERTAGWLPVVAALSGNGFLTLIKFGGFAVSGSSAMFSEAVHSLADTLNQALLWVGLRRSRKKPDAKFVYGYGKERFLWALISACGIFFLGAGVTVYHGIESLLHPGTPEFHPVSFLILAISLVIESGTFWVAYREITHGKKFDWEEIKEGDPTTLAVLFEDGVAVLGVGVAFVSIGLSVLTGSPLWDALGSIIIGLMLAAVAVLLINRNREFLIEKSVPKEVKERVIALLEADPMIERVLNFKSAMLDVGTYRVTCDVEFNGSILLKDMGQNGFLRDEFDALQGDYSEFLRYSSDLCDRVPRLVGERINDLERKIRRAVPAVQHIDIELN